MLPTRPSLLLLVVCLTSLCHAEESPLFVKCGKSSFVKTSEIEQSYFVSWDPKNDEASLTFKSRQGKRIKCSAFNEVASVEQALEIFGHQKNFGTLVDDSKNKFFILSANTAIPWLSLDEVSMLSCDDGLKLEFPGQNFNIHYDTEPLCEAAMQKIMQALKDRAEQKAKQRLAEEQKRVEVEQEETHDYWRPPGPGYSKLFAKWLMDREDERPGLKRVRLNNE